MGRQVLKKPAPRFFPGVDWDGGFGDKIPVGTLVAKGSDK
jgi:hypothetical protein